MAVPSLAQLIHRKLIKNITSSYLEPRSNSPPLTVDTVVTDVGVMPYDIVRPILLKIENPQQLVSTSVPRHADYTLADNSLRKHSKPTLLNYVAPMKKSG